MSGWIPGLAAGLGLGVGGLVVLGIVVRRRRALGELIRGIHQLDDGRPPRPVQGTYLGRVGHLCRIFNEVAPRLERRLEQLEGDRQLLGTVLQGMTEGVIAIDGRRRLIFANEAADRLFGLGPEAVGRLVAEVIRSPQVQQSIDATVSSDVIHQGEIVVLPPQGRNRGATLFLDVHGTPLPDGAQAGAVFVFHDVTDLRRLERMRQDFVANASHELKTPLASIKAYTETLLDGALHDESVNMRFLNQIDEQADRLSQLILDLLSLARLESGQDLFQHAPLAIRDAVRRCVETHQTRADSKHLHYRLLVP
ncbi:MAG TPA: histidine kinase dimerization/phospho-acceptor domain-containing protein, partial [Isosphaeraceae bacterium]|nr:histidine kinase dimerization/phospho-acceptor domain-containing protein [Isosphaeraceae bacterium]